MISANPESVHRFVSQGRYGEAYEIARAMAEEVHGPPLPRRFAAWLGLFGAVLQIFGLAGLFHALLRRLARWAFPVALTPEISNAILWGVYWQDLREAIVYNVACAALAPDTRSRLKETAFLFYSLTLLGHATLGLRALRSVLREAEAISDRELVRDLLVWYGVALQWSSRQDDAQAVHARFERDFPDASPFLLLISQASRLHGTLAEVGPIAAHGEAERCFQVSVSLRESRNHIQIYAAKAALLFLEGRASEAAIFLAKARAVARRNRNRLDHLIYWRLASLAYVVSGDAAAARAALLRARSRVRAYGAPVWYVQECAVLKALIDVRADPTWTRRVLAAAELLRKTAWFTTPARLRRVMRVVVRLLTEEVPGFWAAADCLAYLQMITASRVEGSASRQLESLVIHMTQEAARGPDSSLERRLERAFPSFRALSGPSVSELVARLQREGELETFGVLPEAGADSLHLPCRDGRMLVAVRVEAEEAIGHDDIGVVGIVAARLDVVSVDLVEAALRMFVADHVRERGVRWRREQEIASQRDRAVASTVQMLAHDVRKPFSLLRIGLDRLAGAGTDPKTRELAARIREHVGRALVQVNGLLADVLEASGAPQPQSVKEPYPVSALVEGALAQVFSEKSNVDIRFDYDFSHQSLLDVAPMKVQRVFVNILENARQALGSTGGRIEVSTRELLGLGHIEVAIRNSGPLIPEENLARLFEAFYTSGKRGGTGLGLAICKKIISEHGGSIRCDSTPGTGTVFTFILPASKTASTEAGAAPRGLPRTNSEARAMLERGMAGDKHASLTAAVENARREKLVAAVRGQGRPLRVLIVDDEDVYREGVKAELETIPELAGLLVVTLAATAEDAVEASQQDPYALVITDVDLGHDAPSGFELTRQLRGLLPAAKICVHSNRALPTDYREAMASGADAFLPKPMTAAHLLGLLATH